MQKTKRPATEKPITIHFVMARSSDKMECLMQRSEPLQQVLVVFAKMIKKPVNDLRIKHKGRHIFGSGIILRDVWPRPRPLAWYAC